MPGASQAARPESREPLRRGNASVHRQMLRTLPHAGPRPGQLWHERRPRQTSIPKCYTLTAPAAKRGPLEAADDLLPRVGASKKV